MSYPIRQGGNKKPVLVDGCRTAFVKSFGVFQDCDGLELYSRTVEGLLRRTELDPHEIDESICGVVIPQTKNPNIGRDAMTNNSYPVHIHGYTLNRACTSSMQSIADAAKSIAFGQPHIILAGGVECLSNTPITYSKRAQKFLIRLSKAKSLGQRMQIIRDFSWADWIPKQPELAEPLTGYTMGQHAEMMAKINGISREEQDQFAFNSHQKAFAAQQKAYLAEEIVPLWPAPKHKEGIDIDNLIRGDTNLQSLAQLKPAFDRKNGSITAGSSSALTDGAAVTLIADEERAKSLGLKPKAWIRDFCFVGVQSNPQLLIGPAIAIPMLLRRNQLKIEDIDRFEIHEAFAAQVLSCLKSMKDREFMKKHLGLDQAFGEIPMERLNVNGGAIAIGHPFGATGARLATSLANELQRSQKRYGLMAICAAGGIAGAMLIERYT